MARYKPGQSGNLAGRPEGSKNKVSMKLRENITSFLEDNFESVTKTWNSLSGKEKVNFYIQ